MGRKISSTVKYLFTLVLFASCMIPFVLLLINSFKTKRDIIKAPISFIGEHGVTIANYAKALKKMNFERAFTNSAIITVSATALVIVLSAMVAYYFVREANLFSKIVFAMMVAAMIIPFQAIMIPLVSIYGAGLGVLNHRITLILMHTGFAMSMSVFIYQGFIKSNIPLSLEEAAVIDGANRQQVFWIIVFPLIKPTTATLIILNALAFWNDYLLPSLVLGVKDLYTLPLSTYSFYGTYSADYGVIMAALVLTVLPILVMYLMLQKHIIEGVVAGAIKM